MWTLVGRCCGVFAFGFVMDFFLVHVDIGVVIVIDIFLEFFEVVSDRYCWALTM